MKPEILLRKCIDRAIERTKQHYSLTSSYTSYEFALDVLKTLLKEFNHELSFAREILEENERSST